MKSPVLLTLLWLLVTASFAQSGFYARSFDFSRPENSRWEHPPLENIGTMLLDAHLRGELKAYKFDVAHDELKYAPIPKDQLADPWTPKNDYYQEDMVSHNGKMYIARADIAKGARPPDSLIFWEDMQVKGRVISWRHHFPVPADTTTKSFLLSRLVEQDPEGYELWDEKYEYFNMDRVEYQGKLYIALANNFFGVIPGTDNKVWEQLPSHVTLFQSTDLKIVTVLYYYETKNGNTTHTPQMVSIRVMDPMTEAHKNVGLNFFYNDVIKYLERSHQPALYLSDIGHVGGGMFLFDDRAKENFTKWVQAKIISKEIKVDKKAVLGPVEYDIFMATKPEDISHTKWYAVQNPATRDFTIMAGKVNTDYDYYTLPIVSVSYASVEKLLKTLAAPAKPKLYKEIFADTFVTSQIDTISMDSIKVLPAVAHTPDTFKQNYFDELHFDLTDANQLFATTLPSLWDLIKQSKTRFHSSESYYPCRYNWKGTEVVFRTGKMIADENLSVSHVISPPEDLPKPEWKMKEVGVVYRINLNPATEKFHPIQLVVSFEEEAHADLIDYRIDWQDLQKLVAGKKEYDAFIDGIRKASLNFKRTAISYNQIMTR